MPVHQTQLEIAELPVLKFEAEHVRQGPNALLGNVRIVQPGRSGKGAMQ